MPGRPALPGSNPASMLLFAFLHRVLPPEWTAPNLRVAIPSPGTVFLLLVCSYVYQGVTPIWMPSSCDFDCNSVKVPLKRQNQPPWIHDGTETATEFLNVYRWLEMAFR